MVAFHTLYQAGVLLIFGLALLTFITLLFITAPYGRHYQSGWGVTLPARLAWIVMELPAVVVFLAVYFSGAHPGNLVALVLLCLWQMHYLHRTFIFPFRLKAGAKPMPLLVVGMGFLFNCLNGYINAYFLTTMAHYRASWVTSPHFMVGAALFFLGFYINYRSDSILFRLRKAGEKGYQIPRGFLFGWVCSPNYFGELLEWSGFALAAWSLPALGFALYTAANLVPRALAHRRWYRKTFEDFPQKRKAIIPGLL